MMNKLNSIVLIILFNLITISLSAQTCDYTLEMNDSYGDGWNGAYVDLYVNGVLDSGSPHSCAGSQTVSVISIPDGATVYLDYFPGSYEGEVTYTFYDPGNTVLFSDGTNPSTTNPVYGPAVLTCPGDDPCFPLAASTVCGPKSTGSIGTYTNSGVANPGCGNYQGGDVWYTLIIPTSGNIDIEGKSVSGGVSDIAVAAYTAPSCGGSKTLINCNDNGGAGNMPYMSLTGLIAGNILYVRVWEPGNNAAGKFELEITNPDNLFCLTNNASMYNFPADTCMQVTPNSNSQVGCAWYQNTLDFNQNFDHTLDVYCGNNDGGADGMTFTFHNDPQGTTECGNDGQYLGAGGIQNAVVIEVDTWDNGGSQDIADDHVAIWTSASGEGSPIAGPIAARASAPLNIEDGNVHTMRIVWNAGTNTMDVYFDGALRLTVVNDFVTNVFQTSNVFWGSTGSTGGAANQHYVCPPATLIALPIELVRFTSLCQDESVDLLWATASEINNDYFTIERGVDGVNFEAIGEVLGAGNSDQLKEYSWVDKAPFSGVNYYRLKQTDFDGQFSYSKLKAASCKGSVEFALYPNPVLDNVMLTSTSELRIKYEVITMDGRVVAEGDFLSNKKIDLSELSSGAYFVRASSIDEIFQEKLIKK
jgi:hypothetical protein